MQAEKKKMKTNKYLLLIILIAFFIQGCKSQINTFYFQGEKVNSIEKGENWYLINLSSEIKKCNPKIEFIENELSGFAGNVIEVNESNLLIFYSNKYLETDINIVIGQVIADLIQLTQHLNSAGNDTIYPPHLVDHGSLNKLFGCMLLFG